MIKGAREIVMRTFTLAVALLAGCAATAVPGGDAKVRELEQRRGEIAARAKLCILAATKHGSDEMKPANGSGATSKVNVQIAKDEREREISKCKAAEARENEELLAQERNEYVLQAEQERDRDTLIMILTTSRPH
jgi:hypothetical protein